MTRRWHRSVAAVLWLSAIGTVGCHAPTDPVTELRPQAPQLVSGLRKSCLLRPAEGLWCWGIAQTGNTKVPPTLVPPPEGAGPFVMVSTGSHLCALTAVGDAYCWGDNRHGELGDGTTVSRDHPTRVDAPVPFRTIVAGTFSTCALDAERRAWCWGQNDTGALGIGTAAEGGRALRPTRVAGRGQFEALTGGHTWCGLQAGGSPLCWGGAPGSFGGSGMQPGDCTTTYAHWFEGRHCLVPTPMSGTMRFAQLSQGGSIGCGITSSGAAACWGEGWAGGLGNGSAGVGLYAVEPVLVIGGLTFQRITAGSTFVCGLTVPGRAYCWGNNFRGMLGIGVAGTDIGCAFLPAGPSACPGIGIGARPLPVVGGLHFVALAAGGNHTCGLTASGEVWCWGIGGSGELGPDPSLGDSPVPVRVMLP